MRLWEYERDKVKIVTNEGQVLTGLVDVYFDKEDSEAEYASIAFKTNTETIEIAENEIKKIEIIK